MTYERRRNRIEVSGMQLNDKDYICLSVEVEKGAAGANVQIERTADPEEVAKQLEWLAVKLRASIKSIPACQSCGGTGQWAPTELGPDQCSDCSGSGKTQKVRA